MLGYGPLPAHLPLLLPLLPPPPPAIGQAYGMDAVGGSLASIQNSSYFEPPATACGLAGGGAGAVITRQASVSGTGFASTRASNMTEVCACASPRTCIMTEMHVHHPEPASWPRCLFICVCGVASRQDSANGMGYTSHTPSLQHDRGTSACACVCGVGRANLGGMGTMMGCGTVCARDGTMRVGWGVGGGRVCVMVGGKVHDTPHTHTCAHACTRTRTRTRKHAHARAPVSVNSSTPRLSGMLWLIRRPC